MENDTVTKEAIRTILETQFFAVLAAVQEEKPITNIVAFIVSNDLKEIVFATPVHTRKYDAILTNGNISLFVDTRTNTLTDIAETVGISAQGECRVVSGECRADWMVKYIEKYPNLNGFLHDVSTALICMSVARYMVVSSFQKTSEINP